jgi:tetratricopeptide (TPR) repeat protein
LRTTEEGIEISLSGGGGALIAWGFMDEFKVNKTVNPDLNKALSSTNPIRRVQLLKPHIDPLLPFAAAKEGTSNIHGLVDEYLQSVIKINDWLAAYEISQSPLYRIVEKMFVLENNDKALHLLSQLLAARPTLEFNRETTALAKRLAEQRLFGPAYELTRSSLEGASGLDARKFALRSAYLSLELEALDRAGDYIARANTFEAIDDVESKELLKLALGVQAFKAGDSRLALNHLGQALATASMRSDIKQTALYYNYYIYSQMGQKLIVENIFEEMSLLFPDGAYTNALAE